MLIAHHSCYAHPLPENHRFPMEKYVMLAGQLGLEGIGDDPEWHSPVPMAAKNIVRSHSSSYYTSLLNGSWTRAEERRSGFTWSPELIRRESVIMQGTWACAQVASQGDVGLNIAGGTHHAFADRAEGFCLLNDLALSADLLLSNGMAKRVLIVDLDVHQGNGTAAMTRGDDRIFTFSMHGASNYPFHKESSTLDVPLPDGTEDPLYLALLQEHMDTILEDFKPNVVLYQCGVDVLASDKLGKLSLTMEGCMERDRLVLESCRKRDIGVACAMGGGYSKDVSVIVEAHMQTFRLARELWS